MSETANAMTLPTLAPGETSDVTLLLEGTYPYVHGGVSSWIHDIISGMPHLKFAAVFIGSRPSDYQKIKYVLPPNLVHVEAHYLEDAHAVPEPRSLAGNPAAAAMSGELHTMLRDVLMPLTMAVSPILAKLGTPGGITQEEFLYSRESWRQIHTAYETHCTDPSFVNYFWTVRTMHAPIFLLAKLADRIPATRAVHAVSTGYAGLLGAMLVARRKVPYVLSEHGIYTKERRIDLAQATWIQDPEGGLGLTEESYVRHLWIRFFESLGRMTYLHADPIVALYEGNRDRQVADGADPQRTQVIPNGIDLDTFLPLMEQRPKKTPKVVALIGRVVPIKDILGFTRAMRVVCSQDAAAEGWIVGPEDENPSYAEECHRLVATLGLSDKVKFLGMRKTREILPQVGLTMLTSISEALPLVLLESMAAGVPVVATDVGSCRELLEGRDDDDKALGKAGAVVTIANPEAAANAVLAILRDEAVWTAMQAAGRKRVVAYYDRKDMYARYRAIYDELLGGNRGRNRV